MVSRPGRSRSPNGCAICRKVYETRTIIHRSNTCTALTTSFASHACKHGPLSTRGWAPRLAPPTVLTVLTNASVRALRRLPLVTLIIANFSIIPRASYFNSKPVFLLIKHLRHLRRDRGIKASNLFDRHPRKEISHQEFRHLLMLFALPVRRPDCRPIERIERLNLCCECRVICAGVAAADCPWFSCR